MASSVNLDVHQKAFFDSSKFYLLQRNDSFHVSPKRVERSIWQRMPPDFRFQSFKALPQKRRFLTPSNQGQNPQDGVSMQGSAEIQRNRTMPPLTCNEGSDEFKSRFRILRPFSAKVQFSKSGCNPKGPYEPLKPHDFRGIPPIKDLGLPEFRTIFEKDVGSLKQKTNSLSIMRLTLDDSINVKDSRRGNLYQPVVPASKWDPALHLPSEKWPHVTKEFTRYRIIHQDPQAVFLDRVEEMLTNKWEKEKCNK